MPFKTFVAGPLPSAEVNDYLMKQSVIVCTSGTRPASPVNGMTIYETDTGRYITWNGSAWSRVIGGTNWRYAAYSTATLAIPSGTWTTVGGYSTAFTGMAGTESGTTGIASYALGVVTATVECDVDVTFSVVWTGSTNRRGIRITMDGGNNTTPQASTLGAATTNTTMAQQYTGPLAAGHTLEMQVYQDSGASLDITHRVLSVRARRT